MDKSMYSLILKDELVRAVDKLAHENGTSRSGLINRILAEHLSMLTPEMRVAQVFENAARTACARTSLQVQPQSSDSMMVTKSVIRFKYNPAIRYTVELSIENGVYIGEFRAVSRSQSMSLLSRLTIFYEVWSQIEHSCMGQTFPGTQLKYSIDGGRFRRTLMARGVPEDYDTARLGEAVGMYLTCFDTAMNRYFSAEKGIDMETYTSMMNLYQTYLGETQTAI